MGVRLLASVAVLAAAALPACGVESPASAPPTSAGDEHVTTGVHLPATTVFNPPDPNAAPIASQPPIEVTEPCPESDPGGGAGQGKLAEASRLEPMLRQVLANGGQRPAEFVGYGLVWRR